MVFLNFVAWSKEETSEYNLKDKGIFLAIALFCYIFQLISSNLAQKWIGSSISRHFSDMLFQRLLEADVYKVVNNEVASVYRANISRTIRNLDLALPRYLDQIIFNLSTSLGIFILFTLFVSPILATLAPLYFLTIWWIQRKSMSHIEEIKELDTALQTRLSFLLEDITRGIIQIRAAGYTDYFEKRLNIFREKIIQTELFMLGMKFRVSSICFWMNFLLFSLPILVFAGITKGQEDQVIFEKKQSIEQYNTLLAMTLLISSSIPMITRKIIAAANQAFLEICNVNSCLSMTHYDQETTVGVYKFCSYTIDLSKDDDKLFQWHSIHLATEKNSQDPPQILGFVEHLDKPFT